MVQGVGLEPTISKLSVWGLTNLATLTYNGAFYLPTQAPNAGMQVLPLSNLPKGSRIKAHRAYLFNLYTVPSVRLTLHPVT